MTPLKQQIAEWLVGRTLKELRFFQVNPGHVIIEEGRAWAIDGGVELVLDEGVFCFGWSQETDQFEFRQGTIKELSPELDARPLDTKDFWSLDRVIGRPIERAEAETLVWEDLDDADWELLLELRVTLQGGRSLQIAAVDFDPDYDGTDDLYFDLAASILVSIDRNYRIEHPPEEVQ